MRKTKQPRCAMASGLQVMTAGLEQRMGPMPARSLSPVIPRDRSNFGRKKGYCCRWSECMILAAASAGGSSGVILETGNFPPCCPDGAASYPAVPKTHMGKELCLSTLEWGAQHRWLLYSSSSKTLGGTLRCPAVPLQTPPERAG